MLSRAIKTEIKLPLSLGSECFYVAYNDQGIGTMRMNQDHTAKIHMKSSGGIEYSHVQREVCLRYPASIAMALNKKIKQRSNNINLYVPMQW